MSAADCIAYQKYTWNLQSRDISLLRTLYINGTNGVHIEVLLWLNHSRTSSMQMLTHDISCLACKYPWLLAQYSMVIVLHIPHSLCRSIYIVKSSNFNESICLCAQDEPVHMVASFPGPAQLSVACSTEKRIAHGESLGRRLCTWMLCQCQAQYLYFVLSVDLLLTPMYITLLHHHDKFWKGNPR